MRAGELNRRVTFQSRSTGQDSTGGQLLTWVDVVTVWAGIQPLSGRELFAAQAVNSEVTHLIKVRYQVQFVNPKVVAAMRMVYNGRIFNLHASMIIEERNREVQIMASEGLDNG
jgi:SPP1 family predicted phage head-tail adaptor